MGELLDPQDVTELFGCEPTRAEKKGDIMVLGKSGRERVAKAGIWILEASEQEPADLDSQIQEILDRLPSDLTVWRSLSSKYHLDLFCGFFMEKSNEGLEWSTQ